MRTLGAQTHSDNEGLFDLKVDMTIRRVSLAILILCLLYGSADMVWPVQRDLRRFDPATISRIETNMWRSYYAHQPLRLFHELAQMLRTQYQLTLLGAYVGAYYGASAAFTFKAGKQRSDYQRALPALRSYFEMIRRTGNIKFDVQRAASLELTWWIVHRDRAHYPPGAVEHACAQAAAAVYLLPLDATLKHGSLRAAAMMLRDAKDEAGGLSEADWVAVESLLRQSYQALSAVVVESRARLVSATAPLK